ncbi:hypothetical protein JCM6882_003138 [Rhodosporidiobolus microsporus]
MADDTRREDFSSPARDSHPPPPPPTTTTATREGSDQPHLASSPDPPLPLSSAQPAPAQKPHRRRRKHRRHHKPSADDPCDEEDLAGWGRGGERFGGMAQAGLGQDEQAMQAGQEGRVPPGVTSDSASGTSESTGTGSSASSFVSEGEDEEREGQEEQRAAQSVDEGRMRRESEGTRRMKLEAGGSKSFYGGSGQGYMRMLHALANSSHDDSSSSSSTRRPHRSSKPPLSLSKFTSKDDPESVARPNPTATYTHNGPPVPNSPVSDSEGEDEDDSASTASTDASARRDAAAASASMSMSTSDDASPAMSQFISPPERAAQSTSLARCPSEKAISPVTPGGSMSMSMSMSLPSAAPAGEKKPKTMRRRDKIRHPRRAHYRKHGRREGEETTTTEEEEEDDNDDDDEEREGDLNKSTIFAIHRTEGEGEGAEPEGVALEGRVPSSPTSPDASSDEGEDGVRRPPRPGMSRRGTASTIGTKGTRAGAVSHRRERLAEKLREVFGLGEVEEVVAEYPCWLFRSILLQGFLYLTAGHICFYAYLSQKEGATIRSGSLSVRGNKTRRYRKHWFVLKDSVLSWFPSSTDPYFPDGHIDLHYCISIEPSTKHSHHFKVSTSDKKWHFSADSTASRDEWVKTLKKVVFRCQNEGEAVKIAIPLETVVDVEKSAGLEFAETIRVRVYDPDEGFEIDEYWLSYFKNLDAALEKINLVLERFRAQQQQQNQQQPLAAAAAAGLSPIEDTTRRAIADLGESDQVRGVDGERGDDDAQDDDEQDGDGRNRSKSLGERVSSVLSLEGGLSGLKRAGSKNKKGRSKTGPPAAPSAATSASTRSTPRSSIEEEARPVPLAAAPSASAPTGPSGPSASASDSPPSRRSSLNINTKLAAIGGTAVPVSQANLSGGTGGGGSSTATPVAGSVATLRPPSASKDSAGAGAGGEEVAAQGISPLAAAAAVPLPPAITSTASSASSVPAPAVAEGAELDPAVAGAPPALGEVDRTSSGETTSTIPAPAPSSASASAPAPAVAVTEHTPTPTPAHTYPPQPSSTPGNNAPDASGGRSRASSTLSRILSPASSAASTVSHSGRKILEVVTHRGSRSGNGAGGAKREGQVVGGLISEEPEDIREEGEEEGEGEEGEEEKKVREMRRTFGLGEKEELVEHFPAYLYRGLPIYGHVYITTSYFCFKSAVGILNKTKMILPISDIIGVSKHRSYRIGFAGLMVIIKGHEEVFLELSNSERRDACLAKLEHQREVLTAERRAKEKKEGDEDDKDKAVDDGTSNRELQDLLDLSSSKSSDPAFDLPHPRSEAVPGQPPIMFSSTTSDFVTFRPEQPLRFTCLTIGSRGDVQPYIALCKGLMAQGHKCKIASHGEYKKWVEGHGIEFSPVGGDPAELMQLMISHDFFTISFMKEAVGRFRGWLDDLLASAWKGCQDTDVLIESPSAIAGYHIAEALRIPYYRAFTMPWTRTRAYPHAFAVPEVHMGGGYNYMTYTMFDQVFWRATSGQVNRWRKETLKIRSTNFEAMQQHKIPFLYNFSPVVIPPPLDWRENIHVTGYWWLDNPDDSKSKKWEPPEAVLKFLDEAKAKDKKVVFIGFGSIIIPDPMDFTKVIAEAVERAGVHAIVAKGWSDRASSKGDSDEQKREQEDREKVEAEVMDKPFIHNVKSIPHDWLFPRIAAAVHHGGAGTTGASLRAGLPTIIKPFFGDQHFYADRVATLGIGTHIRNFTSDNLAEALTSAVTDEKQIERARLAGEEIRKEDGVATAIECIYRDLEYARSLIPPPSEAPQDSGNAPAEQENDENKADDSTSDAPSTPARTRSRPHTPDRKDSISSPQTESRTTSSDEGWDVMSRGSAADASGSWEKDSMSRASSHTRSREASVSALKHDQKEEQGDAGEAETEAQSGVGARLFSMLTKGPKSTRKEV